MCITCESLFLIEKRVFDEYFLKIGKKTTCKPMAVLFQCMTKFTTNKKKKKRKEKKKFQFHH